MTATPSVLTETPDSLDVLIEPLESLTARRFTELVGAAPMKYLAVWRMQIAKQMMREGSHNIQDIATRVGYDSEAAFNRAFKRATGSPPAAWRTGAVTLNSA